MRRMRSCHLSLFIVSGLLWIGAAVAGQQKFGPNVIANRDGIATAMLARLVDVKEAGAPFSATFTDVNLDGHWELLGHSVGCGNFRPLLLSLQDSRYVDLVALSGLTIGNGPLVPLDQATGGYRDLHAGGVLLAWNGNRYTDASSRARMLQSAQFVSACVAKKEYS